MSPISHTSDTFAVGTYLAPNGMLLCPQCGTQLAPQQHVRSARVRRNVQSGTRRGAKWCSPAAPILPYSTAGTAMLELLWPAVFADLGAPSLVFLDDTNRRIAYRGSTVAGTPGAHLCVPLHRPIPANARFFYMELKVWPGCLAHPPSPHPTSPTPCHHRGRLPPPPRHATSARSPRTLPLMDVPVLVVLLVLAR